MTFLLSRTTTAALGIGIGLSFATFSSFRSSPLRCEYTAPYHRPETASQPHSRETGWTFSTTNDPSARKQSTTHNDIKGGFLNASLMRQLSLGSVLGLVAGVGLRAFSRSLTVLVGMAIVLVQWAASKGYNIVPVGRLQKYVKNVDLQRALTENMSFKMSFGTVMALAAFAQF